MSTSLTSLRPRWWALPGRHGQGVTFDCPCCKGTPRAARIAVAFQPALDGGEPINVKKIEPLWDAIKEPGEDFPHNVVPPGIVWARTGDTFETLTISPSVDANASGHWHGWVQSGQVS